MPGVTLYRLRGISRDLAAFVDVQKIGLPIAVRAGNDVSLALWRKREAPMSPPAWTKLVRESFSDQAFDPPGEHDSALIVLGITVDGIAACWALAFGAAGRHWLHEAMIDRDAHLVAAIEVLRNRETGVISGLTRVVATDITRQAQRITREMARESGLATFEFESDIQVLRGTKGVPMDKTLGRTILAGESMHLTAIKSFPGALAAVIALEQAVRFGRTRESPVPGVRELPPGPLTNRLDELVVEQVRDRNSDLALVLPDAAKDEPLSLELVPEASGIEDYDIGDLRDELMLAGEFATVTSERLMEMRLRSSSDSAAEYLPWSHFSSIVPLDDRLYILEEDRWYGAPAGWLAKVNDRVDRLELIDDFPRYAHDDENKYNKHLEESFRNALCLDKQLTRGTGFGRSGIEILDVLALKRFRGRNGLRFIATKRGLRSGDLSHLFLQVKTAIDSLQDADVRAAFLRVVRAHAAPGRLLETVDEVFGPAGVYDTSRVELVLAIVGEWRGRPASQAIPVLARSGLQQLIARSRALGHELFIARVSPVIPAPRRHETRANSKRNKASAARKRSVRRT